MFSTKEALTSEDKAKLKRVVPKNSNKILDAAVARLYIAYPDPNNWTYTGLTGAIVLVDDLVGHTFFLKLVDIIGNRGVLWDQELYVNFEYNQDRVFFHSFEIEDCYVGLLFEDKHEATRFYKKLLSREKHGSKLTVNNKNAIALKKKLPDPDSSSGKIGLRGDMSNISDDKASLDITSSQRTRRTKGIIYYDDVPPPEWRSFYKELESAGISEDMIADNREFIKDYIRKKGGPLVGLEPPIPRKYQFASNNNNHSNNNNNSNSTRPSAEFTRSRSSTVSSNTTNSKKKAPPPPPPPGAPSISPSPESDSISIPSSAPPQYTQHATDGSTPTTPTIAEHPKHSVPPLMTNTPVHKAPPAFQPPPGQPSFAPGFAAGGPPPPPSRANMATPPTSLPPRTNMASSPFGASPPTALPPRTNMAPQYGAPPSRYGSGAVPPPPPSRGGAPPPAPPPRFEPSQAHQQQSRMAPPPPPPSRRNAAPPPPPSRTSTVSSPIAQSPIAPPLPPHHQDALHHTVPQSFSPPPPQTQQRPMVLPPREPYQAPQAAVAPQPAQYQQPPQHQQIPVAPPPPPMGATSSIPVAPPPPPMGGASNIPVAPPPPPMGGASGVPVAPPPPPMGGSMAQSTPPLPQVDGGRDALLASIRGAGLGSLKKVDKSQLDKPSILLSEARGETPAVSNSSSGPSGGPPGGQNSLADALAAALSARKEKVGHSDNSDNEEW
ncbi:unnamed protein product [[Candida] boidinii]|uniref:Unnamed protein product n=1 Tax=Candida boidinii TaxID=5477 RepID=A0ACB5TR73_CANBO|nr:unnamed protein product [[Candida] boidinii]